MTDITGQNGLLSLDRLSQGCGESDHRHLLGVHLDVEHHPFLFMAHTVAMVTMTAYCDS